MANRGARSTIEAMTNEALIAASTSWPEAAIAIVGVALVGAVAVVVVWQTLRERRDHRAEDER
jgi:MFS superfamily sulfate permease-like transporter